jgi:transcriptional antiterminator NusG
MEKQLEKRWYIIHTYSGYEKKVKTDLEKRIESLDLKDRVFRIVVPEEESVEIRRGKKKTVSRKLFPGYVMVEMLVEREESNEGIGFRVDSEAWYVIRNTNGVTGFVGVGSEPTPLEDSEVRTLFRKIGLEAGEAGEKEVRIELDFKEGDLVELLEGGFVGNTGKVSEIDYEHKKVKVMLEMFGRMTPVEVSFEGVRKA